jgi:hypothetical protein
VEFGAKDHRFTVDLHVAIAVVIAHIRLCVFIEVCFFNLYHHILIWQVEGVVAVGIGGRLFQDLPAGGIQQADAHAADACLPGVLQPIPIFIEPDPVADPLALRTRGSPGEPHIPPRCSECCGDIRHRTRS